MSRHIMPIMGSSLMSEIPFAMIAPHEKQALRNHGQSLERLAQRGGLSAGEAIAILEGHTWIQIEPQGGNERHLIRKVRVWRAALTEATTAPSNRDSTACASKRSAEKGKPE